MTEASNKDQRFARLASTLARAATAGDIDPMDALRVIRHELRERNRDRALQAPRRSVSAQEVIDRYAAAGENIPKNSSNEALHSDHVAKLTVEDLHQLQTPEQWLAELVRLDEVVCVTAAENYLLEGFERRGVTGWEKYEAAGIVLIEVGAP